MVAAAPAWEDRGRPFWALVFTITRRRLADRSRAAGRVTTPESLPEALEAAALPLPDPEDVLLAQERAADVGALLRQLPDTQREVVVLRTLVGLSVAETAAALGLAHGSVHVLHHRAMRRLREALGRA